jgi:acyl-CoA reductase-like NAD-dependent aldehyde dehydrogenase
MGVIPDLVPNFIDGEEVEAASGARFDNINPHNGSVLCQVASSEAEDIGRAVEAAKAAQEAWADLTPVARGDILREAALAIRDRRDEIAEIVALETGKSIDDARGETLGAFELGMFMAGEGRRYFGRTCTSANPNREVIILRQPVGVCGLIIAANTPIANVAWKAFPALLCGNSAVMKCAEDTPATGWIVAKIFHEAGVPAGVFNMLQGLGPQAGQPLVEHADVDLVSFTGSAAVGRMIAAVAGERLAKVILELGGKNPLVVCDDANLEKAADAVILSAFSNAGQRCASGSRIIAFDSIYDDLKRMVVERAESLKLGPDNDDDLGPVINERQLQNMLTAIRQAQADGARVLTGGHRLEDDAHRDGFYLAPTLIEQADPGDPISRDELFGPITCLYRVSGFEEALELANESPFGLTCAIHTSNLHRAMRYAAKMRSGLVSINGFTYGSEPHMPFGGLKQSGNGLREPGPEAIDVYSAQKNVLIQTDPTAV